MISRVAECCFWLFRYIERAESSARLVGTNRLIALDAQIEDAERWKPVVIVVGEQARFEELVGTALYHDDDSAEQYLTWSDKNPVSIRNSLYWARDNARMTRELISREMWETLNTGWQWFNGKAAQREFKKDRSQFYQRIRSMCAEFHGAADSTMLHEEPFDFMRLGMVLERANQTARLMDVKYHRVTTPEKETTETPWQSAEWVSQLRLCAADEPFFKRHRSAPTGRRVAEFLLKDPTFPRSVRHCFERASELVVSVQTAAERKQPTNSLEATRAMLERLRSMSMASVLQSGLHDELTRVVDAVALICEQLRKDFFDPASELDLKLPESLAPAHRAEAEAQAEAQAEAAQSQSQSQL